MGEGEDERVDNRVGVAEGVVVGTGVAKYVPVVKSHDLDSFCIKAETVYVVFGSKGLAGTKTSFWEAGGSSSVELYAIST